VPGGGYFGTRKANEPVHVQYRFDERTVDVVNSSLQPYVALRVSARVFDMQGRQQFQKEAALDLAADGVAHSFSVPEQSGTSFLRLELHDKAGKLLSQNFYAIPRKLADLQWDKSNYFYTPANNYADLSDLEKLPRADVQATYTRGAGKRGLVRFINKGKNVAFFLHAAAVRPGTDEEIVPVLWSDNFVSLLPGESRELSFELPELTTGEVSIKIEGWNIAPQTLQASRIGARKSNSKPTGKQL